MAGSFQLLRRAMRVYRTEGWPGVRRRLSLMIGGDAAHQAATAQFSLHIDSPDVDSGTAAPWSGRIWIHGWAVGAEPIEAVTASLNETPLGEVHFGLPRPDVGALFPDIADAWKSGFALPVDSTCFSDGTYSLRLSLIAGKEVRKSFTARISIDNRETAYDRWLAARKTAPATAAPPNDEVRFIATIAGGAANKAGQAQTEASLAAQTYTGWTLAEAPPDPAALDPDCYILPLTAGDVLAPHALAALAQACMDAPALAYGDEDRIDEAGGRADPRFKPGWSPTLLDSGNYMGRPILLRAGALAQAGLSCPADEGAEYAALLQLAKEGARAAHVPDILCSRPNASPAHMPPPAKRTRHAAPKVSLIIPTRAGTPLIRDCLTALYRDTAYENYEIVLIANPDPADKAANEFIANYPAQKVTCPPPFNWSGYNNAGAAAANGEVLAFVNDDIAPIAPDWIEAMLDHALKPDVGPVGAKLLFGDGRIQHAGIFLCDQGGGSRHAFRFLDGDDPGYLGLAQSAREVIAVTGACLMVERAKFERLGGFDEALALVSNDVDFCLRARDAGLSSIYAPKAALYHHEGVTRQAMPEDADVKLYHARWKHLYENGAQDPYFNPNLDPERDDFWIKL